MKDKIGKFQVAEGWTVILDDVEELPIELQPKPLSALQEK